jgi:hypothetical protein
MFKDRRLAMLAVQGDLMDLERMEAMRTEQERMEAMRTEQDRMEEPLLVQWTCLVQDNSLPMQLFPKSVKHKITGELAVIYCDQLPVSLSELYELDGNDLADKQPHVCISVPATAHLELNSDPYQAAKLPTGRGRVCIVKTYSKDPPLLMNDIVQVKGVLELGSGDEPEDKLPIIHAISCKKLSPIDLLPSSAELDLAFSSCTLS